MIQHEELQFISTTNYTNAGHGIRNEGDGMQNLFYFLFAENALDAFA